MRCKKFFILGILFLCTIVFTLEVNAAATWIGYGTGTPFNCAASSSQSGNECNHIYDGFVYLSSTTWATTQPINPIGQWISVDMGSLKKISGVNIHYNDYFVFQVKIDVSTDCVNYNTALSGWTFDSNSAGNLNCGYSCAPFNYPHWAWTYRDILGSPTAKCIRIYITGNPNGEQSAYLGEIELKVDDVCTPNCAGKVCGSDGCEDTCPPGCPSSTPLCNSQYGFCFLCNQNPDCGTDGLTGASFCKAGDDSYVYRNYTTYTCTNPGSSASSCSSLITENIVQTCDADEKCYNGNCVPYHSCEFPEDIILKLSSSYNAHGALWGDSNYFFEVCFNETFGFFYSGTDPHNCESGNTNKVIGLSDTGNAHAEIPELDNYGTDVCYGDLICRNVSGNCDSDEKAVIALSSFTNAHISNISDLVYPINICCKPESSSPSGECVDECINGQKICNGDYMHTCGDYDRDGCTEWDVGIYCSEGCDSGSGQCIIPPTCDLEGIYSCNDYGDSRNCSEDRCLVASGSCSSPFPTSNTCGSGTLGGIVPGSCNCFWNPDINSGAGGCMENTTISVRVGTVDLIGTCDISIDDKGECVDGIMVVNRQSTFKWDLISLDELVNNPPDTTVTSRNSAETWANIHCTLGDCFSGTRMMVCSDDSIRLGFFNWINFLIAIMLIAIIYFMLIFYPNNIYIY